MENTATGTHMSTAQPTTMQFGEGSEKVEKELLEWELSLHSSDLRAHAWYHGGICRLDAENLLQLEGHFLVRDSSSGRPGDFVLSVVCKGCVLHFLIQKDVLQPNTIYEQLGYRFENESFPTVPDLITFHVGNGAPISAKSGAKITVPCNREAPLSQMADILPDHFDMRESGDNYDYVSLLRDAKLMSKSLHSIASDKSTHSDSPYQVCLDLKAPNGLLEELAAVPSAIKSNASVKCVIDELTKAKCGSNFELSNVSSIVFPSTLSMNELVLNQEVVQIINTRLLETSDRSLAYHLTKVDWNALAMCNHAGFALDENDDFESEENILDTGESSLYDKCFGESQIRWNVVIERCLSMSHFVIVTILCSQDREAMFSKWIRVADQLKTSMGNFMSFFCVMKGLNAPSLSRTEDGPLDWMKLRREFTSSTFLFETSLRSAYKGLLQGSESYPPNLVLPHLFPSSLILEDCWELFPGSEHLNPQEKLGLTVSHLKLILLSSKQEKVQKRNFERLSSDLQIPEDLILLDIFRTEVILVLLWGHMYNETSLRSRCERYDDIRIQI